MEVFFVSKLKGNTLFQVNFTYLLNKVVTYKYGLTSLPTLILIKKLVVLKTF